MVSLSAPLSFFNRHFKAVVVFFFGLYLLLGVATFGDYGLSWDETFSRTFGLVSWNFVTRGDEELLTSVDRYHGPFFEIVLVGVEKVFHLGDDPRRIFFARHLVTFLLFYASVFFFTLLARDRFQSWKIGLLGGLFLVLSPRIYADSFYNSKDIALLAFFVFSFYTFLKFLRFKTPGWAFWHALACALLIDVRIVGLIVVLLTVAFLTVDLGLALHEQDRKKKKKGESLGRFVASALIGGAVLAGIFSVSASSAVLDGFIKNHPVAAHVGFLILFLLFFRLLLGMTGDAAARRIIKCAGLYLALLSVFTVLFWPTLWQNPFYHLVSAFNQMKQYPWGGTVLYLGQDVDSAKLPWHYLGVWILITTPVVLSFNFLVGCLASVKTFLKNKEDLVFLSWFFLPILMILVLKTTVYDGWRHVYFVYPAFILISLKGLVFLWEVAKTKLQRAPGFFLRGALVSALVLNMSGVVIFMVRNHPYQNVYFNRLAGRSMQEAKDLFEMDYWGLSYRNAMEYILEHDADSVIRISALNYPGYSNALILKPEQRERLVYTQDPQSAKYYLSNYRGHQDDYSFAEEFYAIDVGGAKIMVVLKNA